MARKINTTTFSNAQKKTLREFFNTTNSKQFTTITQIKNFLKVDDPYEVIRQQYNDAIENERRIKQREQAKKRRESKKIPVLFDKVYTNNKEQVVNDLRAVAPKLVGKKTVYVQYDTNNQIVNLSGKDGDAIFWNSLYPLFYKYVDGQIMNVLDSYDRVRVVILLSDEIIPKKMQQKYRDGGEKHCVIEPIYNLFITQANNSKSIESRKKLERTAKQIKNYENVYPDGVPEEDMEMIAKSAGLVIVIHDILGNEINTYNKNAKRYIRFTNTRVNHIEQGKLCLDNKPDPVTQEELNQLIYEHDRDGIFYIFKGTNEIRSIRGCWRVNNIDNEIMQKFSESIDIQKCSYDALNYPEMNELIVEARIINAAPTPLCDNPNDIEDANHIDLSKAYTLHKECEYYRGFCGVLHQWRKLNITFNVADFLEKHLGIFQFKVTSRNNDFLNMLGIFNDNVYSLPSVEILYFIREFKMTCVLLAGAWGSRFDFEYTDEMLENRRYCIWAGKNGMQHEENLYTFKGNKEWASHIATSIGKENVSFFPCKDAGIIMCKVPNKVSYTRHHILAFITSYTRINMMQIMRKIPQQSLIKVILDGIYFRGDIPDITLPCKNNKELKKHIAFKDFWYNVSTVNTSKWPEYKKDFDGNCVLSGAGGTGKTHTILTDRGFVNPRYIVPMHSLGQQIMDKYKVGYNTMHKFIGKGCISNRVQYGLVPNVILIDELTMHDGNDIETAIKMYPESLVFVAGDIDKKQWYQCRNGENGVFNNLWQPQDWRYVNFEKDRRSLDDDLRKFKLEVREKMREIFTNGEIKNAKQIAEWASKRCNTITFDDAVKKFTKGDIWIAGTHNTNKKLLENGVVSGYIKNKQITFDAEGAEKRGSFTTHSFQGLTIENKRVFISIDDSFEYAMFYTAISRVRHFSQLVFVENRCSQNMTK